MGCCCFAHPSLPVHLWPLGSLWWLWFIIHRRGQTSRERQPQAWLGEPALFILFWISELKTQMLEAPCFFFPFFFYSCEYGLWVLSDMRTHTVTVSGQAADTQYIVIVKFQRGVDWARCLRRSVIKLDELEGSWDEKQWQTNCSKGFINPLSEVKLPLLR